jgi:putative nucleotidyltransferase with HDIG domain
VAEADKASAEFVVDRLVERALGSIEAYFGIPHVLAELLRLIDAPDTSADELAQMIETDPSLTLRLLRVVNSAAFSFSRTITSVREAIILLGFNEVKYICISRALKAQVMRSRSDNVIIPRKRFWHHSVATAVFAKLLAKHAGLDPGTSYVGGLIHDIGWVAIELALPEATRRVLDAAEKGRTWPENHEIRLLGFTHADAGAWLMKKWDLPELLQYIVLVHHHPEEARHDQRHAWVVHLADAMATVCFPFFSDHLMPEEPEETAWKALGLSEDVRENVVAEFSESMARMGEILRL